jgi:tellurite resistance protein TehA-like permease
MIASVAGNVLDTVLKILAFQWSVGIQFIICVTLGHFVAVKTGRSHLNWILTGLFAGVIPVAGIVFMVGALLWYPPPAPRSRAGYHPRRTARDRRHDAGGTRRDGR